MKTSVVIATFNGKLFLAALLRSLEQYQTDCEILVVDNYSSDMESLQYLDQLRHYSGPLSLRVTNPPYKHGYEPGAFLFAFREYPSDRYLFLHDSMLAKSPQWLSQFEERYAHSKPCVVPWISFSPLLMGCHTGHLEFLLKNFGPDSWPEWGIFGSIFYTSGEVLRDIDQAGFLPPQVTPNSKTGAEGMERGFAIAFQRAAVKLNPVHQGIDLEKVHFDQYPHLRKIFAGRK